MRLALINVLSNLMVPLAGLIDTAFLGHLDNIRHLAGVSLATVLFNYIYWSFGFLRMGTTGTTAQAMGRGDRQETLTIGLRNGLLALGLGVVILVLQQPLQTLGFALLSATPGVEASGRIYFQAMIWGAPATLLNYVLLGWFLGQAQGRQVLLLSLVGNGANIVLDYWLIYRWGWESLGAGAATAASQYLMLLVGLGLVSRQVSRQDVGAIAPRLLNPAALRQTFGLNRDILVRTFALVSTFALFTNLSSALGTVVLATNAVLLQVVSLAAYFIDGLAFATESMAGLFHGQGSQAQLATLVKLAGTVSLGLGLAFALVFNLFPQALFGLLTSHRDVLDQIVQYVIWLLPVLGFGSVAYMLDGYFLGLTAGRMLRQSSLTASLVGFGPMAIAAWQLQSSHLLWFALTLFMAARTLTLGWHLPQTFRRPCESDQF